MDIEGLGDKLVDQLVDGHVVRTLPDLYRLGLVALASLDRMAEKSAQNVLDALEKSKKTTLSRFLFGLGDRKSTRLNSSHSQISYAVFCLKKKNKNTSGRGSKTANALRATA